MLQRAVNRNGATLQAQDGPVKSLRASTRGLKENKEAVNEEKKRIVVQKKPDITASAPLVYIDREPRTIDHELNVVEFADDVHVYLLASEKSYDIPPNFLDNGVVNQKHRSVLIDWLVQVHQRFHLLPETLYLTIYLLDSVLAEHHIGKKELQLYGVTSMVVASKFEEIYAPELQDFVQIADYGFTKADIIEAEKKIIMATGFLLNRPHSILFVRWLNKELSLPVKQYHAAKYFCEAALVDYKLASVRPSHIAAASVYIASVISGDVPATKDICDLMRMSVTELYQNVSLVSQAVIVADSNQKLAAVKTKHSGHKFHSASQLNSDAIVLLKSLL